MSVKSVLISTLLILLFIDCARAQKQQLEIQRIEPAFWWVGMKNQELQVLIYGPGISASTASINYTGVEITRTEKTENPNYQFLYLKISPSAKPGMVPINFQLGKKKKVINYELKVREKAGTEFKGFTSSDVLYLIMPDRFANGDESNDWLPGMLEKPNRAEPFFRHGGDLKGIENNLDYLIGGNNIQVFDNPANLENFLASQPWNNKNLVMMSSGDFGGMNINTLADKILA